MTITLTLSADPVARMNSLYGLKDKQFTCRTTRREICENIDIKTGNND